MKKRCAWWTWVQSSLHTHWAPSSHIIIIIMSTTSEKFRLDQSENSDARRSSESRPNCYDYSPHKTEFFLKLRASQKPSFWNDWPKKWHCSTILMAYFPHYHVLVILQYVDEKEFFKTVYQQNFQFWARKHELHGYVLLIGQRYVVTKIRAKDIDRV